MVIVKLTIANSVMLVVVNYFLLKHFSTGVVPRGSVKGVWWANQL